MDRSYQLQRGFTLMELIMVIVIAGILGTMTVSFITKPMEAYIDLNRRAELVDHAEMSMRMMARDIRAALPNSIKVDSNGIMVIPTVAGGRYTIDGPQALDFGKEIESFGFEGHLDVPTSAARVAIYNLGVSGADAHEGTGSPHVLGPVATVNPTGLRIELSNEHQFPFSSPRQRFYLVDPQVKRYCCANNSLYLQRHNIATTPHACGGSGDVRVSRHISSCDFQYDSGTATRSGLVTIQLSLSSEGETISLLHQVHVDNVP